MRKILIVVDMQNDFIDGSLGTPEAVAVVDKVVEKMRGQVWDDIIFTQDTHQNEFGNNYLNTQEGKKLPILHCIACTRGWSINQKIIEAVSELNDRTVITKFYKPTFASLELVNWINRIGFNAMNTEITIVGVCTDICVISNALLLKAYFPETRIVVDASCCAGTTVGNHFAALKVMSSCQIDIVDC